MNYFIYTLHHFTPHGRYELHKLISLPMCGFIGQLVEHRTGIAEVTGLNPVEALIFFGFFFPIIYCNDHSSLWSITVVHIWIICRIRCHMMAVGHGLSRSAILVLLVLSFRSLGVINDLGPCVSSSSGKGSQCSLEMCFFWLTRRRPNKLEPTSFIQRTKGWIPWIFSYCLLDRSGMHSQEFLVLWARRYVVL